MTNLPLTSQVWSSGYKLSVPFDVVLPNGQVATCEDVVRALPGRRYVCRGSLNNKAVFIKLFSMSHKASKEWHAEQAGIIALEKAGIAAPGIIDAGVVDDIGQVVVYAALAGAESALQRWDEGDEASRLEVLIDLVELLAEHHAKGLRQSDLHLLNFVYSENILYTLDASDIHASAKPLSRSASMDGLADLLALLPIEYDELIGDLYSNYWSVRGEQGNDTERTGLVQRTSHKRRYKLRKYLAKIFRSCTAFVMNKSWSSFTVYDRDFESDELKALVAAPDHVDVTRDVTMVKDGNTCTVTSFRLASTSLVCKRYNIKNSWHALSRAFRPSRAACSWKNSHHLLRCGIATARPVAMCEQRFGPLRGKAWLYIEKIDGENLYYYHHHPEKLAGDTFRRIVQAFMVLFEKMVRERISHGDMKLGNFIFHAETLYVIDLDSMQGHDRESTFAAAFSRDMRRFFKNWQNYPATSALFIEALSQTIVAPYLPVDTNRE